MALDGDLAQFIKTGRFLFNETVQAAPPTTAEVSAFVADPDAEASVIDTYHDIGHTSVDEGFAFDSEEGSTQTVSTFQVDNFLEYEDTAPVDRFSVTPHQVKDPYVQRLYWGGGEVIEGAFKAPKSAARAPIIGSGLVLGWYGPEWLGFWLPKLSVRRNGGIAFDPKTLMAMPLIATILEPDGDLGPVYTLSPDFTVAP